MAFGTRYGTATATIAEQTYGISGLVMGKASHSQANPALVAQLKKIVQEETIKSRNIHSLDDAVRYVNKSQHPRIEAIQPFLKEYLDKGGDPDDPRIGQVMTVLHQTLVDFQNRAR